MFTVKTEKDDVGLRARIEKGVFSAPENFLVSLSQVSDMASRGIDGDEIESRSILAEKPQVGLNKSLKGPRVTF